MESLVYDFEKRLESAINRLKESDMPEANKQAIIHFCTDSLADGLSKARVSKYVLLLKILACWLGRDFESATRDDIRDVVLNLEKSSYAGHTKKELKMLLKRMYKWLRKSEDFPPEVSWIKLRHNSSAKLKLPEEILTEDDVQSIIRAAGNPRDRAMVAVLYESGCRIGEFLGIKIKHITTDDFGAQMVVNGKTGARRIRLVSSVPYLMDWLNKHPSCGGSDAFVWVTSKCELIGYTRTRYILANLTKKAGINKHVHPHLFRHSRATYLANHLTEAQMKEVFGWIQASEMASIYVHLSGRDVDNALLRVYGIDNQENPKESKLKPKACGRCAKQNPSSNVFCSRCGYPLDEAKRLEMMKSEMDRKKADGILDELIKDHEFRELFVRKLQQLQPGRA